MKAKAVQACKCSNKITFLCNSCIKVHLADPTEEHNLLAMYLAKYILNKKIIEKTKSLYTNDCEELLDKLKSYMNEISTFRTNLTEKNKKILSELQYHMSRSTTILNNIEKEIRTKIKILNVHSKKPFKEGLNLIDTFRNKGLKRVLTVCPTFLRISEKNVLKEISSLIYMGDSLYQDQDDLLLTKLSRYNQHFNQKNTIIEELEGKLASYDDKIKSLSKEQTYLNDCITKKDETIEEFESSLIHKNSQIKQLSAKINEMKDVLNSGYSYIQKLECQNTDLNVSVEELQDKTQELEIELRIKEGRLVEGLQKEKLNQTKCQDKIDNTKQSTRKLLEGVLESLAETKRKLGSPMGISSRTRLESR